MKFTRILKHLLTTEWRLKRAFPRHALLEIEKTIGLAEVGHSGEIRFAVEAALDGPPLFREQAARERAIDVFSQLRVWDTEHNNGVLIYLLLADRDVEIVADRGIASKVGAEEWERVCRLMESHLKQGHYEKAVIEGIREVASHLRTHFPLTGTKANQIPDRPAFL